MAESSATLHEYRDLLADETVDVHRGIVSRMEEFEAIDWYSQRVDAAEDADLKAILGQNRDEEEEHADMLLQRWRRLEPGLNTNMLTAPFTAGDILDDAGERD